MCSDSTMENRSSDGRHAMTKRKRQTRVLIIGAGVIGLASAHVLVNNGYGVTILAQDFMAPDNLSKITSQVASAVWQIPVGAHNFTFEDDQKIRDWCMQSYRRFSVLARRSEDTGVFMLENVYVYRQMIQDLPEIMSVVKEHRHLPGFRHSAELIKEKDLSGSGVVDAFSFVGPTVDTDVYLTWLTGQLLSKGVDFVRGTVAGPLRAQVDALRREHRADWVVNCTGVGAREVAEDCNVYPVRGAGVIVRKADCHFKTPDYNLYTSTYWHDECNKGQGHMLIVPRGNHSLWLGTLLQETADKDLQLSHPIVRRMLSEVADYIPPLRDIPERDLGISVGVRPMRHGGPRVELDPQCSAVVHNYGHMSFGVMLSWGCADHVLKILNELQQPTANL